MMFSVFVVTQTEKAFHPIEPTDGRNMFGALGLRAPEGLALDQVTDSQTGASVDVASSC